MEVDVEKVNRAILPFIDKPSSKAPGTKDVQDLQQTTSLPVVAVKPLGDKLTRAHTIVPAWEAHRFFAYEGAAFLNDFLVEIYSFPKSSHDDQVDSFVQGARYLTIRDSNQEFMQFMKEERRVVLRIDLSWRSGPQTRFRRTDCRDTNKSDCSRVLFLLKRGGEHLQPSSSK